ncbi:MAG TPA: hypothetical protein VF399_00325 [bacterium]
MREIKSIYYKYYPGLILYIDDLWQIINIFKDHPKKTELVLGKYIIDDVNELKNFPDKKANFLTLTADSPYIKLYLSKSNNFIALETEDNQFLRGLLVRIENIILRRRRFWSYLNPVFFSILILLFTIISMLYVIITIPFGTRFLITLFACWAIPTSFGYFMQYLEKNKSFEIYLYVNKDEPNFFKRNSSSLFLAFICNALIPIIVAIIIFFLNKILNLFFK